MCGRYEQIKTVGELESRFGVELEDELELPYSTDVRPTTMVPIVLPDRLTLARWGIVPPWEKEPKTKYPTFNARSEEVWTKPTFKNLLMGGRCGVPVPAFFEWPVIDGKKVKKRIAVVDDQYFIAGLHNVWNGQLRTCTMLTTAATPAMQGTHDRMPLYLPKLLEREWLNPSITRKEVEELLNIVPEVEFDIQDSTV